MEVCRAAMAFDREEKELKLGLGLSWVEGRSLGWRGLVTPVWLGRGHGGHSFSSSKSTARRRFPCSACPRTARAPALHPHLGSQCPSLPHDTASQTPGLPCVPSKSCPFLKMDGTLQTPYAQFSFIILISNYLGRFPVLASAVILVPADALCSLPLLIASFF